MIVRALVAIVLLLAGAPAVRAEEPPAAEKLLDQLVGDWRMTGTVRGKPVTYRLSARRTLAGRFVELHMIDVSDPPKYEARVFIGNDPKGDRIIAHWMDKFGAAASIPHGEGSVSGNTIRFDIPYPDGTFRDVFTYEARLGTWQLKIDAADGKGGWTPFAEYAIERAP